MLGFRVLGKRELSQLSSLELVTPLMMPETAPPSLTAGDHPSSGALVGVTTLWMLTCASPILSYTSRWFRRVSESTPAVLVRHGRLFEANLHRERIRSDELHSEIHLNGIEELERVKWAILETGGKVSFVRTDAGDTAPRRTTASGDDMRRGEASGGPGREGVPRQPPPAPAFPPTCAHSARSAIAGVQSPPSSRAAVRSASA